MGNYRPLPRKCWENFLTSNGFIYSGRTKGSHDQWTKGGHRTIPVWGDEKEIPPFHLRTGCRTMNVNIKDLYDWAAKNC
jgi:predicted RNA binding protein YcfA (HicA-like mRNA interferase family)